MKFAMTTILAAALATVSSAVAVPSVAVGASLPASFNLRVTTATRGTVLEPYLGSIYTTHYAGQALMIGSNRERMPPMLFKLDGKASVATFDTSVQMVGGLLIVNDSVGHTYPMGWLINRLRSPNDPTSGEFFSNWASGDYVQVNNAFAYDARDGKGPQTLWYACPDDFTEKTWIIFWNTPSSKCVPVQLSVVAV